MKYIFLLALAFISFACSNPSTTVLVENQVISPHTLTYAHGVSTLPLSITHTCTCPFSWNVTVLTNTTVFKDTSGTGDNKNVPISIDRSKMTTDTVISALQIKSNYINIDTVIVTVYK